MPPFLKNMLENLSPAEADALDEYLDETKDVAREIRITMIDSNKYLSNKYSQIQLENAKKLKKAVSSNSSLALGLMITPDF